MKNLILTLSSLLLITTMVNAQKLDFDKEKGKEYADQVEESMGVYDNAEMTAYVNKIGERLVAQLEEPLFDFKFKMVPTSVPNAFALPGGYLYVTTGIIPLLESEDELACVMAHEIIHAQNRHAVKSMRRGILPAILQIPGNVLGVFNHQLGNAINSPIQAVSSLGMASYSRKQESEADTEGVELAAKAGYDPNALKSALTRLADAMELMSGEAEEKSYLSDHPYTPDRVAKIDKLISSFDYQESANISSDFLGEFDGVLIGDDPTHGVVEDQLFIHPEFNFRILFPEDWEIQAQKDMVAAQSKDEKAGVIGSFEVSDVSPDSAGQAFLAQINPQYQSYIHGSEKVMISGRPGYMVSFQANSEKGTVYGFRLWIKYDNILQSFYAVGYLDQRKMLEEIMYSIRHISDEERSKVKISHLNVVTATGAENLAAINKRTNSDIDPKLSSLINDVDLDSKLEKGSQIKTVLSTPYFE